MANAAAVLGPVTADETAEICQHALAIVVLQAGGKLKTASNPFDLARVVIDDLARIGGRRSLRGPRHATVMPDSRIQYKRKRLRASVPPCVVIRRSGSAKG